MTASSECSVWPTCDWFPEPVDAVCDPCDWFPEPVDAVCDPCDWFPEPVDAVCDHRVAGSPGSEFTCRQLVSCGVQNLHIASCLRSVEVARM